MLSAVYFVDGQTGRAVLGRDYRGDLSPSSTYLDLYTHHLLTRNSNNAADQEQGNADNPVWEAKGVTFFTITSSSAVKTDQLSSSSPSAPSIIVLGMARRNVNAIAALTFLRQVLQVLKKEKVSFQCPFPFLSCMSINYLIDWVGCGRVCGRAGYSRTLAEEFCHRAGIVG